MEAIGHAGSNDRIVLAAVRTSTTKLLDEVFHTFGVSMVYMGWDKHFVRLHLKPLQGFY